MNQKNQKIANRSEQAAEVSGPVEYRLGDGPKATVPQGPIRVTTTDIDATLSWQDGDTHASASMPLADFQRYVADGAITLRAAGR
ncbi:MAG TPA: hypothetical protein PKA20_03740 [Burkholderiaceae bacterium]|nr:hypothetical protein [Burkholderiaceae bacterium]